MDLTAKKYWMLSTANIIFMLPMHVYMRATDIINQAAAAAEEAEPLPENTAGGEGEQQGSCCF